MAKAASRYISELLEAYQSITQKAYMEIALDLGTTLSNMYRYRNGTGNPRAKTIDKIVNGAEKHCPEVLQKVSRWQAGTMGKRTTQAAIFDLLSCLGVTLNYKGYNQAAYASGLCPNWLRNCSARDEWSQRKRPMAGASEPPRQKN